MTTDAHLRRRIWSWAIFQGFRDPYVMLIVIYGFVPYFVTTVVDNPAHGQALVASGAKYAGWIVMLTAPLLGATVDRMGARKPWLGIAVALMIPLLASLWWARPDGSGLSIPAVVGVLAALAVLFAWTETMHNALLVPAAGMARAGQASGLGLALGNAASVAMLVFVLWGFALPGKVASPLIPAHPLWGLDPVTHAPDRVGPLIVAVFLGLGTLPLLRFVPDVPATGLRLATAVRLGIADLGALVREARGNRDALTYLGARMLFTDGLTGILIFTGVYAAGAMGWHTPELLVYGILLSCFSVVGGLLAGWLDARIGPQRALTLELAGVIVSQLLSLGIGRDLLFYQPIVAHLVWAGPVFRTAPELALLGCGFLGAVSVTAAYSSSRTMLTRVVPPEKIGIFFGLFVIAGAATAWLAPLLVQLATDASGSQRVGLLPLAGLLLLGMVVLQFVHLRTPESEPVPAY